MPQKMLPGRRHPQAACSNPQCSDANTTLSSREGMETSWRGFQKEGRTAARELPTTTAADSTFFLGGTAGRGGGPGRGGPGRGGPGSASAPAVSSPEGLLCRGLLRPFWCPEKLLAAQGLWRQISALQSSLAVSSGKGMQQTTHLSLRRLRRCWAAEADIFHSMTFLCRSTVCSHRHLSRGLYGAVCGGPPPPS